MKTLAAAALIACALTGDVLGSGLALRHFSRPGLEKCCKARPDPSAQPRAAIGDVAWIAGAWTAGTSATVEERWTPPAGGAMLGMSRTVRAGRMTEFEFLRIVERDGGLVYIAQPNGAAPTEFTMTAIDAESVTFENPAHDFPKMIRYARKAGGLLEASISGGAGTKTMSWNFKPLPADARQ